MNWLDVTRRSFISVMCWVCRGWLIRSIWGRRDIILKFSCMMGDKAWSSWKQICIICLGRWKLWDWWCISSILRSVWISKGLRRSCLFEWHSTSKRCRLRSVSIACFTRWLSWFRWSFITSKNVKLLSSSWSMMHFDWCSVIHADVLFWSHDLSSSKGWYIISIPNLGRSWSFVWSFFWRLITGRHERRLCVLIFISVLSSSLLCCFLSVGRVRSEDWNWCLSSRRCVDFYMLRCSPIHYETI